MAGIMIYPEPDSGTLVFKLPRFSAPKMGNDFHPKYDISQRLPSSTESLIIVAMSKNMKAVTIPNIAWNTAADIYFPPDFDEKRKHAAVVSAHPIGSCKEPTSGNVYGKAMAEAGFVVVAFDASFQGLPADSRVWWRTPNCE